LAQTFCKISESSLFISFKEQQFSLSIDYSLFNAIKNRGLNFLRSEGRDLDIHLDRTTFFSWRIDIFVESPPGSQVCHFWGMKSPGEKGFLKKSKNADKFF